MAAPARETEVYALDANFSVAVFERIAALLLLIVTLPVMVLSGLTIFLLSRQPPLIAHMRAGQFGRSFWTIKLRTMWKRTRLPRDCRLLEELIDEIGPEHKDEFDGRVSNRFARFCRRFSIDELPQFWNVVRGEMSLVGPRPPIRYEFDCYQLWHRRRVLEAKPGITGVWQVNGRSRTNFDEMVRMDLHYIRNRSFWFDLKILVKTPFAVLSGDGAH